MSGATVVAGLLCLTGSNLAPAGAEPFPRSKLPKGSGYYWKDYAHCGHLDNVISMHSSNGELPECSGPSDDARVDCLNAQKESRGAVLIKWKKEYIKGRSGYFCFWSRGTKQDISMQFVPYAADSAVFYTGRQQKCSLGIAAGKHAPKQVDPYRLDSKVDETIDIPGWRIGPRDRMRIGC